MAAGFNSKATLWRTNYDDDDIVGGAQVTGTNVYVNIPCRISGRPRSQAALEAGLEVNQVFDMVLIGKGLTLNERDEVEVTWPLDHPHCGDRFRVTGIQRDSRRRRYGHTNMTLRRIERSRTRQ